MIRVAVCESDKSFGKRFCAALDATMRKIGVQNAEVSVIGSYSDLGTLMMHLRADYFDFIFCRMEAEGGPEVYERMTSVTRLLKERSPNSHFVLASSKPDVAYCAYKTESRFLGIPFDQMAYEHAIEKPLREIAESKYRRIGLKSVKGTINVNLNDITFAETGKKGLVIHLPIDREIMTRGTLQSLFDKFSKLDERFVRAGGSFVINLDSVRSVGESSVIFGDGATIILPTRARKPIREAFLAYQLRPE